MIKMYLPSKSIFTELAIIYCQSCKCNHYVLTVPSCGLHKIEECQKIGNSKNV